MPSSKTVALLRRAKLAQSTDQVAHPSRARTLRSGLLALLGTRTLVGTSASLLVTSALLVVTRTLLGAPGRTTRRTERLAAPGVAGRPRLSPRWLPCAAGTGGSSKAFEVAVDRVVH